MRILYAEDEHQLSAAVAEILKMEGYDVDTVYDGEEAWKHLQSSYYDAVILDIMMPKMNGLQVLKLMREHEMYTSVLMLTAKNEIDDKIEGLEIGADDYLGKPFAMKELIARLNSMVRRSAQYKNATLSYCGISLNCDTGELRSDNGSLRLSNKESEMLALFIKQTNYTFSPQKINELLWDSKQTDTTVTLYISYLNNKLKQIQADIYLDSDEKGYFIGVHAHEKA